MASLIPGYNYDIFISYRQKDNRGEKWVSEFVEALKDELESTFKEEVSVYFDINPHDGLLEMHDVNASLREKLKCLVFIPIISQTYCDSESFAWKHEFCEFNRFARIDQFGRDIRVASGNIASRILPVKIHEIDQEDKVLLENELGGILRSIEFIYKSAGVNRPLRTNEDHPKDNLNKTYYRDQLNKVANAVKEIIAGLKKFNNPVFINSAKESIKTGINADNYGKSIAVLPFKNVSSDKDNEYFSDGITEEIINTLAGIADLRVIARTSAFVFKNVDYDIREIGEKLCVATVLEGSVRKAGDNLRINANLIDTSTGYQIWSDRYDGTVNDIFALQEKLALRIVESLRIQLSTSESLRIGEHQIDDPRVFEIWLRARQKANLITPDGLNSSISLIKQAESLVGSYPLLDAALAYFYCLAYDFGINHNDQTLLLAEDLARGAVCKNPKLSLALNAIGYVSYKRGELQEAVNFYIRAEQIDHNNDVLMWLGIALSMVGKMDQAGKYSDKAIIRDPLSFASHFPHNLVLLFQGKFEEAISFFENDTNKLAPDEPFAEWWLAQSYAYGGRENEAVQLFERIATKEAAVLSPLSNLFASALKNNREQTLFILESTEIKSVSMTDEYFPTYIASALAIVGENEEAIGWLEQAVSWGFSNHLWLHNYNRFLKPLTGNHRFEEVIKRAREKEKAFKL